MTAESTTASQAAPTGTVTVALADEPITMDPMFANGVTEYDINMCIMDGLLAHGPALEIVPALAEKTASIDATTWEFTLRRGVKFHNGEPFNAEAVKVTYERSMNPDIHVKNPWGSDLNIKEIEVVDDYTVRFHTSTPTPHMLARVSFNEFIYPPKYLTDSDPNVLARKPIGTGPFVFKEWAAGQRITLEANPDYWGDPKPAVKTAVWTWIPEDTTRLASLKTKAIDIMDRVLPTAIDEIKAENDLTVVPVKGTRRVFAGINTKLKPMDDVRVRQAINYGTDIESICKTILGGATTRMKNWVNPPFQNPDVTGYTYDPDKAKQLLKDAGLEGGLTVTFDYTQNAALGADEFPQAIATSLKEIGVNVKLNVMDGNIFDSRLKDRKASELFCYTNTAYFDPGLTFNNWRPDHVRNAMQFDDLEFLDLVDKLYTGGTADERLQWSYRAQAILMDKAPALFLWKQPEIYGVNKRVQNFEPYGDERLRLAPVRLSS